MSNYFRTFYRAVFPDRVSILRKTLKGCESVLDLGCGKDSPLQFCFVKHSVGVDDFEPYIIESRAKKIHNNYIKLGLAESNFEPRSFDAVLALEVLEHMPKENGIALVEKMEKWARKRVVISVPNGFVEQEEYDNNPLQKHLSSWTPEDFKKRGYNVYGFHGWKNLRGELSEIRFKPVFLWERISDLTQLVAYRFPGMSFQFYAIKKIK